MKSFILVVFLALSGSLLAQDLDCTRFKNGTFKMDDGQGGITVIERKGSKQTEYSEETEIKLQFKIKWIDDCTYTLELKKVLEDPNKLWTPIDMILTSEITELKDNSCIVKSTSDLFPMVLVSELFVMD